jgi:hypothetical protein
MALYIALPVFKAVFKLLLDLLEVTKDFHSSCSVNQNLFLKTTRLPTKITVVSLLLFVNKKNSCVVIGKVLTSCKPKALKHLKEYFNFNYTLNQKQKISKNTYKYVKLRIRNTGHFLLLLPHNYF